MGGGGSCVGPVELVGVVRLTRLWAEDVRL